MNFFLTLRTKIIKCCKSKNINFLTKMKFLVVSLFFAVFLVVSSLVAGQQDDGSNNNAALSHKHLPHQHQLTVVLKKGDADRCFYVHSGVLEDRMFFEYRAKSGKINFDVTIKQPGGQVVFQSAAGEYEEKGGNKVFFISKAIGEYSMCLGNPTDNKASVVINAAVASKKRAAKKRDPVVRSVGVMRATVEALLQDQEFLRSRERSHRDTLEDTNVRLLVRFFVEVIALLGMSVGQVYFLRRLFDKRRQREA